MHVEATPFEMLNPMDNTFQMSAWFVGDESLYSFSNVFQEKFGIPPNERDNNSFQTNLNSFRTNVAV